MMIAQIVLAAIVALPPGAGSEARVDALVVRLGSSRYAEREAAARALEELGRDALPALRAARDARDPEVRSRAAGLIERIESALMVRPTLVRLDFRDRPLGEVVAQLSERSGINLALMPENHPMWQTRRVTLEAPEPLPFWDAIDRLCGAAQLQHSLAMQMGGAGMPGSVVQLLPGEAGDSPVSVRGPFRTSINGGHYQRDVVFGARALRTTVLPPGVQPPPAQQGQVDPGRSVIEQFYYDLQVMAEPRMVLSQNGQPKLTEVVDDKGHSLLPSSDPEQDQRAGIYTHMVSMGATSFQTRLDLRYPAGAGQRIRTLKGTVPVIIWSRKEDPLVVPLVDAKGKTFRNEAVEIIVHEMKAEPNEPGTTIDLTVRELNGSGDGMDPRFGNEMLAFRHPNTGQSPIEVLDDQGRIYHNWFPMGGPRAEPGEVRVTLRLMPHEGLGAPTQIRYYDMARATTEVRFEFHDVPMP